MKIAYRPFDWKLSLLYGLLAYAVVLGVRSLQPFPLPDAVTMVDGERLLATHDAYNWVVRAIDPATFGKDAFASLTSVLKSLTGLSYDTLAFWSPAVLASLVAVAMLCLCVAVGCAELGVAAAVVTALSPSFLYRTLHGFYDTDLVTLLCPLLLVIAPIHLLHGRILTPGEALRGWLGKEQQGRSSGRKGGGESVQDREAGMALWAMLLLTGIAGWMMRDLHVFFDYLSKIFPLMALGLVLVLGPSGKRLPLLAGIALYALPMGGELPGTLLAILLLAALVRPAAWAERFLTARYCAPLLAAGIVLIGVDGELIHSVITRVELYLKPEETGGVAVRGFSLAVSFPAVVQSVIEAQNLRWVEMFQYFYPLAIVSILGCAGYLVALWFAPSLAMLLPLFALGLLSPKLGGRMAMFAAPAMAAGLVVPLHLLLRKFWQSGYGRRAVRLGLAAALTGLLVVPVVNLMPQLPVVPFISVPHVQALKAAKPKLTPGGTIWTWWDWGFATQYFTGLRTFADGARHNSDRLYPSAAVYATDSPRLANQLIRYIMAHGESMYPAIEGKSREEVLQLMQDLRETDMDIPLRRPQYLAVSVDSLKLGAWISRFGSWDFATASMAGYNLTKLGQISLNLQMGAFAETSGSIRTPMAVDSVDIITAAGVQHREFFRFNGVHLVIDDLTDTRYIMDTRMYRSMMVRLLIGNPEAEDITPYFRLVYGNAHTRVYEVL